MFAATSPRQLINDNHALILEYSGACGGGVSDFVAINSQLGCCPVLPVCDSVKQCRPSLCRSVQGGAKNGATLSHCKYSENSVTELR